MHELRDEYSSYSNRSAHRSTRTRRRVPTIMPPVWDDSDDEEPRPEVVAENVPSTAEMLELSGEDTLGSIREIVLRGRGLRDGALAPLLEPLTALEVLSVSNNFLRALPGLKTLSSLHTININFNQVASLEPLSVCTKLACLYAASNRVSSVAPLSALVELRAVSLYRNRIGSLDVCLDVLASLPLLEELDLGANPCAVGQAYKHQLVSWLPRLASLDSEPITSLDHEMAAAYAAENDPDGEFAAAPQAAALQHRRGAQGSSSSHTADVLTLDDDDGAPAPSAADGSFYAAAYDDDDDDDDFGDGGAKTHAARVAAAMAEAAEAAEAAEQQQQPANAPTANGGGSSRPGTGVGRSRPGTGAARPGTAATRPGTAALRPGTGVMRPGTRGGRPPTAGGAGSEGERPSTASVRPASIFRDPWLNNNSILLEYLSQAELEKRNTPVGAPEQAPDSSGGSGGSGASRATTALDVQSAVGSLELPDGSSAGVVSLRRPLVERLRMTAQAMESAAHADVASLAASTLFDGDEKEGGGGLHGASEAAAELRDLILAVQDLTAERDEARNSLDKLRKEAEAGGEAEELTLLREQNAALRAENANMFTMMEENEALRTELETLRCQLECAAPQDA